MLCSPKSELSGTESGQVCGPSPMCFSDPTHWSPAGAQAMCRCSAPAQTRTRAPLLVPGLVRDALPTEGRAGAARARAQGLLRPRFFASAGRACARARPGAPPPLGRGAPCPAAGPQGACQERARVTQVPQGRRGDQLAVVLVGGGGGSMPLGGSRRRGRRVRAARWRRQKG